MNRGAYRRSQKRWENTRIPLLKPNRPKCLICATVLEFGLEAVPCQLSGLESSYRIFLQGLCAAGIPGYCATTYPYCGFALANPVGMLARLLRTCIWTILGEGLAPTDPNEVGRLMSIPFLCVTKCQVSRAYMTLKGSGLEATEKGCGYIFGTIVDSKKWLHFEVTCLGTGPSNLSFRVTNTISSALLNFDQSVLGFGQSHR